MIKVTAVEVLEGARLRVEFSNAAAGEIDLTEHLFGPVFEPLKDPGLFARVRVDEFGALSWPNGADLAPEALHARITGRVPIPSYLLVAESGLAWPARSRHGDQLATSP